MVMASRGWAVWTAAVLCSVLGRVDSAPMGRGMFVWGCRFVLEVNSSMSDKSWSGLLTLDGAPVRTACSVVSSTADIRSTGQAGASGVVLKFTNDIAEKGDIYIRCGQVVSCLQVVSPEYFIGLKHQSRSLMATVDSSHDAPALPILVVAVVSGVVVLLAMLLLCAACTQKQVSEETVATTKDGGVTITRSRSLNVDSRNIVSADQGSRLAAHDRPESGELLGVGMATKENGTAGDTSTEGADADFHRKSMSSRKLPELPTPPPSGGAGNSGGQSHSQQGEGTDGSQPQQEAQYESASSRGAEGPYESIPDRNYQSQDDLYEAVKDQEAERQRRYDEESGGQRRHGYARVKDVEKHRLAPSETGTTTGPAAGAESAELSEEAPPVPVKNYDPNDMLEERDEPVQQAAAAADSRKTPDYTEVTARESLASIRQRETAASQANPNVYYEVQDNVYAQVDNGSTLSGSSAGPAPTPTPLLTPPPLPDAHPPGRTSVSTAGPPNLKTAAPDNIHLHLPEPSRNSTASDMRDYEEIKDMPIAAPSGDLYETVGGESADPPTPATASGPTGQAVYAKINKDRSKSTKEGQDVPKPQDQPSTSHAGDQHAPHQTLGVVGSQVDQLYAQVNKPHRHSQQSAEGHGHDPRVEAEPPYSKVKETTGGDPGEPLYNRVKDGQVEPPYSRVKDSSHCVEKGAAAASSVVDARDDGYATLKDPRGMGAAAGQDGVPSVPGMPLGKTTVLVEGEDLEGYENLGDWQPAAAQLPDHQGASPGQPKLGETFWQKAEHLYDEIPQNQGEAEDETLIPTTEL